MEWAGIDVRHGGNPVISHNIIKNGQSDGIVIGDQGKSVIFDNTIEGMLIFLFLFSQLAQDIVQRPSNVIFGHGC